MQKSDGTWTIFIVECADGTYYTDMTQDLKKKLWEINNLEGIYFSKHSERLPVHIVFQENNLEFKEAYAKFRYLRNMNKRVKKKLIETKKWPAGKIIYEYLKQIKEN